MSVRDFARRRMYRLLVPYWVVLAVAYLTLPVWRLAVKGDVPGDLYSAGAILSNVSCVADVFGQPSPMLFLWTVATLIQVYALWSAVFWAARWSFLRCRFPDFHERAVRVLMCVSVAVAVVLGGLSWCDQLPNMVWQLPRFCPYAAVGAMSYWVGVKQMKPWPLVLALAVMASGAWVSNSPRPLFAGAVVVLLVAASLGQRAADGWRRVDFVSFVGERSYSIYLVHGFVGVRLWAGLEFAGWRPETDLEAVLFLLLAVAASIGVGHLLFRFVEKPLADRAAKVEYRR